MILSPGDRVVVVAPASSMRSADRELVGEATRLLESWGLVPEVCVEVSGYMYLAGTDDDRLAALNGALTAPDVRPVFCSRGGYGSQRLLRHLDFSAVPSERILIGFSDITALHLAAQAHADRNRSALHLVHGPNVATHQLLGDTDDARQNRDDLRTMLFDPSSTSTKVEVLIDGQATGRLVGGCLSLIATQVGTPFMPSLDGAIVFAEDVGESPYKIDRMLHQLLNAGLLDRVAGFVFGVMHNCTDPYNDIGDVIVDVLAPLMIPVVFGLRSGHGARNIAIQLGTSATIDGAAENLTIRHDHG